MVNPEQVTFLFGTIKEDDPLFEKTVLECHEIAPQTTCTCGYSGEEIYVCPVRGAAGTGKRQGNCCHEY